MSTSFQAKSEDAAAEPRLRLMRDRLDELDALLDKMLALPLPTPEGPPPLRLHEPDPTGEPGATTEAESTPAAVEASSPASPADDDGETTASLSLADHLPFAPGDQNRDGPEQGPAVAAEPPPIRLATDFDADLAATEARLAASASASPSLHPMTTATVSRTMMVLEQPLRSPLSPSSPSEDPPPAWWLNLLGWSGLLLLLAAAALTLGRWLAQP